VSDGHILVVEDEGHLAEGLRYNLESEGYEVDCVDTGEAALEKTAARDYSAIVLDIMLPGISGFQVAKEIRSRGKFVPILMLTARGRSQDVLEGFAAGADDYLPKPFELAILLARLKALLRRAQWKPAEREENIDIYEFADKRIDFENLELLAGGELLRLTLMEAQLLRYLIQRKGSVVPRKAILEEVWGVHEDTDTRAIDNFVARLRKYIEDDPGQPRHLLTVRGVGYRFEP
jgi:DNA-binding response OmpR family regulator